MTRDCWSITFARAPFPPETLDALGSAQIMLGRYAAAIVTLVFDVGVSLAVVGLVFMVFEAFGDEQLTAADLAARDERDRR